MSNEARRLEVSPNAFLLLKRPSLIEAAVSGVGDVMSLQGYTTNVDACYDPETAQTTSGLEFLTQEYNRNHVIDAHDYLDMMRMQTEVSGRPVDRILAVTDQELSVPGREFLFGATSADARFSVLSLANLIKSQVRYGLQTQATRQLARRQYAMISGMPFDDEFGDTVDVTKINHSSSSCTLGGIKSIAELLRSGEKMADSETAGFCAICVAKLRQL
jgi:hypothetical protein